MMFFPASAQVNIYFSIENEQVVGTNYEFDIYMNGDLAGTYHSRGQVYVYYNTAAFGNDVVANGNCSFTHLTLLNGIAMAGPVPIGPKYTTVNFVDNGNRIVLTWLTNFLFSIPSPFAHNEIPLTPTPLYHVTIAIQDPTQPPSLALDLGLMRNQCFYLTAPGLETPYQDGLLPVQLSSFGAEPIEGSRKALLQWETQAEVDASHFVLEKKVNEGAFLPLARINAQGNSNNRNSYRFEDDSFMGERNAYRLKEVNYNGDFAYSDEVALSFPAPTGTWVEAYPNPAQGRLQLRAVRPLQERVRYELTHLSGQRLMQGEFFRLRGSQHRSQPAGPGRLPAQAQRS
jgi:hypothetical protein